MPDRIANCDYESYSNPLPPTDICYRNQEHPIHHPMTNDDFRKLLMTPRACPAATPTISEDDTPHPSIHRPMTNDDFSKLPMTPRASPAATPTISDDTPHPSIHRPIHCSTANNKFRKLWASWASFGCVSEPRTHPAATPTTSKDVTPHSSYDASLKQQQEYRDRAKERRDGANPDYQNEDPITSATEYRAVAPDAKSVLDAAQRRHQMIQESKFLGGDMKHTHLVKGLDYALLQKVRTEINYKENEEKEMESLLIEHNKVKDEEEEIQFKTKLGKNIYQTIFKSQHPERSELFLPKRMAYIFNMEDEDAESDIPTTQIRSKADCPSYESLTTLTTNDIVIKKLTETLSYLRLGLHNKRGKRKDKAKQNEDDAKKPKLADDSIFGDIGEYVPVLDERRKSKTEKNPDVEKRKSYFQKSESDDWGSMLNREYAAHNVEHIKDKLMMGISKDDSRLKAKLTSKLERRMPDCYAECYPGAPENEDAVADSDDEVDYSKMDMGNKKGPVGRWDFDTPEEYSEYMSNKEALPKAAFQYGVKMANGRKTRRMGTGKRDEKTKLDRELQKINQIIARRKNVDSFTSGVGTPEYKRPRY